MPDGLGYGMGFSTGPREGAVPGGYMMNQFATLDMNADGFVEADEAAASIESMFLMMDANDDGVLSEEEFMSFRKGPMATMIEHGTRDQQRQDARRERFAPMDDDESGSVDQAEFMTAGKRRYEESALDGNGRVEVWEFPSVRR